MANNIKIYFQLDANELHGESTESVWVEKLPNENCKLMNIPIFAYGISLYDEVSTKKINDQLFFDRLLIPSGHSTYRVMVESNCNKNGVFEEYLKFLSDLGCTYEGMLGEVRIIAINVPPTVNIFTAYKFLEKGESDDVWTFEEGNCSHQTS